MLALLHQVGSIPGKNKLHFDEVKMMSVLY
jgi:hypothetical protein